MVSTGERRDQMRRGKAKKSEARAKPYCPNGTDRYTNKSEYRKSKKEKGNGINK